MRIVHAKIMPMEGPMIENGFLRVENGVIAQIGAMADTVSMAGDFDAHGMTLVPGFVDIHTCVGLKEECSRVEGNDFNESSDPLTPNVRALDGFYAKDAAIDLARNSGVTAAITMPGNMNLLGGQAMAVRFSGNTAREMALVETCGMKFSLGEEPRAAYGARGKAPLTRMGQVAMLRSMLSGAKKAMRLGTPTEKQEALFALFRGEMPAYFHAQRADDIETALRLADEFSFRLIIVNGADSAEVADMLLRANVPVAVGALTMCNARMESKNLGPDIPAKLYQRGVKFAITSDHHQSPLFLLPVSAAFAVREGLPVEEALRAITLYPAQIAGLADKIGSLKPGKLADMALFTGHPLSYRVKAQRVWIGGAQVK